MLVDARGRAAGFAALLTLLAALGAYAFLPSQGQANTGTPQSTTHKLCDIREFPSGEIGEKASAKGAQASSAHASGIAGSLLKFVVERGVGGSLEKYGVMGFSSLTRAINADFLTPDTMEQKVLDGLRAINARLDQVETRIGQVGDRVNQVIDLHLEGRLADELNSICETANGQMVIYEDWKSSIEAGIRLGTLLNGPDPAAAERPNAKGTTPLAMLRRNVNEFLDHYKYGRVEIGKELGLLRKALVANPRNPDQRGALTNYGSVLMSRNRFITHADSAALRALYVELSEIRALTSWLQAEYWEAIDDPYKEEAVWDSFFADHKAAEAGLPREIPPGVVVDLGDKPRSSTNQMPMWQAPSGSDLGWLPRNYIGHDMFVIDDVDLAISDLNRRENHLTGWHAPDKQEFLALISDGCRANPHNPSQALVGCRNAVPGGANIAAYLQRINPGNKNWQELFCQRSVNPGCPPGAGPTAFRQPPHAFVWTSDVHIQRLNCIQHGAKTTLELRTYAGYPTLGAVKHEIYPHFPGTVDANCAAYLKSLIGDSGRGIKRNHLFEGALLATRFTNDRDVNPASNWDYMAQPVTR